MHNSKVETYTIILFSMKVACLSEDLDTKQTAV